MIYVVDPRTRAKMFKHTIQKMIKQKLGVRKEEMKEKIINEELNSYQLT